MAATEEQIARLGAMAPAGTAEETLEEYLNRYPLLDERGRTPYWLDTSASPPTQVENEDWIPTYDLHAAAADLWEQYAGTLVGNFDFKDAAGQDFKRSQAFNNAMAMTRLHKSRRAPKSFTGRKWPSERSSDQPSWIGNLPEPDEE